MQLPDNLVRSVQNGKCVLFLGAGASNRVKTATGKEFASTEQIGSILSDRFLHGNFKKQNLRSIAELAISEATVRDVQEVVNECLMDGIPTSAHRLLPTFPWAGLVTTNYDLLIESAYDKSPVQLHPTISDSRLAKDSPRSYRDVEYLKLHGCISQWQDTSCPMVLSTSQYALYRRNRSTPFKRFFDWARQYTFIFVGFSFSDEDIQEHLLEIEPDSRSRWYVVGPDISDVHERNYSKRNITSIRGTFADFVSSLDKSIPKANRSLIQSALPSSHAIERKFTVAGAKASITLQNALDTSFVLIGDDFDVPKATGKDFFSGAAKPFQGLFSDLVFERRHQPDFEFDLLCDLDRKGGTTALIKGPAGSGKSVVLQAAALEIAKAKDVIVLYHREGTSFPGAELCEILDYTTDALWLFVDSASDVIDDIESFLQANRYREHRIYVVGAERGNESFNKSLEQRLNPDHTLTLGKLTKKEARYLLDRLDHAKCLGHLALVPAAERVEALLSSLGARGDLLVAIYNATYGASLEDHLVSEYGGIEPEEAKRIYLTVCTLHRLSEKVRAGVISRIHKLAFEQLYEKFLAPLIGIVLIEEDKDTRDIHFRTRHSVIADIVFTHVLREETDRLNLLLKCADGLQTGYTSDDILLQRMVNHDTVKDFFDDPDNARLYYDKLLEKLDEWITYHQAALYETTFGKDLQRAESFLERAYELNPGYLPIRHTQCHLYMLKANDEPDSKLRSALLRKASVEADRLIKIGGSPYPFHTRILIYCDHIRSLQQESSPDLETIGELAEAAEKLLSQASHDFPSDGKVMESEARLSEVLGDGDRAEQALRDAIRINPKRTGALVALSRILRQRGKGDEAIDLLKGAIREAANDLRLVIRLAELVIATPGHLGDLDQIRALLDRIRKPATLLKVEVLFARVLIEMDRLEEAVAVFGELRRCKPYGGNRWRLYAIDDPIEAEFDRFESLGGAFFNSGKVGRIFAPRNVVGQSKFYKGRTYRVMVAFNAFGAVSTWAEGETSNVE